MNKLNSIFKKIAKMDKFNEDKLEKYEIEFNNPNDIIKDLDRAKNTLMEKANVLIAKKKKLYSNIDISQPMSAEEKALDSELALIFSEINKIVQQKRNVKR